MDGYEEAQSRLRLSGAYPQRLRASIRGVVLPGLGLASRKGGFFTSENVLSPVPPSTPFVQRSSHIIAGLVNLWTHLFEGRWQAILPLQELQETS